MLVLSRKINEEILIGNTPIRVQVLALNDGRVRLGIQAPDDVPILRGELRPFPRDQRHPDGEAQAKT